MSGRVWVCAVCGRRSVWAAGWAWFGRLDDPPEVIVCSKECRDRAPVATREPTQR